MGEVFLAKISGAAGFEKPCIVKTLDREKCDLQDPSTQRAEEGTGLGLQIRTLRDVLRGPDPCIDRSDEEGNSEDHDKGEGPGDESIGCGNPP
jgi:hypothetical protein